MVVVSSDRRWIAGAVAGGHDAQDTKRTIERNQGRTWTKFWIIIINVAWPLSNVTTRGNLKRLLVPQDPWESSL